MDRAEPAVKRKLPRRGIYVLPSMLTMGNVFCGFYAILVLLSSALVATAQGKMDWAAADNAAKALGIAIILDGFDGKIARMTRATSQFGLQLDSLADAISFGLAPAVLLWYWLWHLRVVGDWAWIACFIYLTCGVMRLARFNIQIPGVKHFLGLPIPAGAGCVAALAHFTAKYGRWEFFANPVFAWALFGLSVTLGLFMVSTIRYGSFKNVGFKNGKSYFSILFIATFIAGVCFFSHEVLMVFAYGYALSGIAGTLRRKIARRHFSPDGQLRKASA